MLVVNNEPASSSKKTRGDADAKQWAHDLAEDFGQAVKFWREKLELSAVELSNRTKESGYPITRATIAKIESNARNSKVDVAEVLTLAAALRVAPIDLIFPGLPEKKVRATRRASMRSGHAQEWFKGDSAYQSAPLSQVGGAHMPMIENSEGLRRRIGDYEKYRDSLQSLVNQETGSPFVAAPFHVEGAADYKLQLGLLLARVTGFNGSVQLPQWFQFLEDETGESD